MTAVHVRPLEPGEEAVLRRLVAEAVPPDVADAGGHPDAPRTERVLRGDVVFVAEVDGHQAGYVAVAETDDALVVEQLVISPADEGRHVGHRLLDWVEGYGTSRGLRYVRITVEEENHRARDFYARRGYLPAGAELERELVHP